MTRPAGNWRPISLPGDASGCQFEIQGAGEYWQDAAGTERATAVVLHFRPPLPEGWQLVFRENASAMVAIRPELRRPPVVWPTNIVQPPPTEVDDLEISRHAVNLPLIDGHIRSISIRMRHLDGTAVPANLDVGVKICRPWIPIDRVGGGFTLDSDFYPLTRALANWRSNTQRRNY